MVNAWMEHIRHHAKERGATYACVMPDAANTYATTSPTSKTSNPIERPTPHEIPARVKTPQEIQKYKPPARQVVV